MLEPLEFVSGECSSSFKVIHASMPWNSQEAESRIQARNNPSLHFVLKVGNMSFLPNLGVLISKNHVAETGNVSLTLFWGIFLRNWPKTYVFCNINPKHTPGAE